MTFLVTSKDAGALSGAEFVADSDWFGLRTHPIPAGSVTFGGVAVSIPAGHEAGARVVLGFRPESLEVASEGVPARVEVALR